MANGIIRVPTPVNEPVRAYSPGSAERASLEAALASALGEEVEIPLVIGGEHVRTGTTASAVCPHDHGHRLATFHQAGPEEVARAVAASEEAWGQWS